MPVDRLEPLNSLQSIPWNVIINERHVIQPHTWYTCPSGKKALVKYRFKGDGLGAAAEIYLEVNAVRIAGWKNITANVSHGDNAVQSNQGMSSIGSFAAGEVSLNEGETIITSQDAGTNGEFNGFLEIQESPA